MGTFFISRSVITHNNFAILWYINAPGLWTGCQALASNRGSPDSDRRPMHEGFVMDEMPLGQRFWSSTKFPCHFHSTNAPYPFTYLPPVLYNLSFWILRLINTHFFMFMVRASWINVNNCPTRCDYIQFNIFLQTALHVSGDTFTHHQEHV